MIHRSIEARLAVYPLFALACILMYQSTNAGLYFLIGWGVYFWAFAEGEVSFLLGLLFEFDGADEGIGCLSGAVDTAKEESRLDESLRFFSRQGIFDWGLMSLRIASAAALDGVLTYKFFTTTYSQIYIFHASRTLDLDLSNFGEILFRLDQERPSGMRNTELALNSAYWGLFPFYCLFFTSLRRGRAIQEGASNWRYQPQ